MSTNFMKNFMDKMKPDGIPSSSQTVNSIEHVRTGETMNAVSAKVSSDSGHKVMNDIDKLLKDSQAYITDKTGQDHLQKAVTHLRRAQNMMDTSDIRKSAQSGEITKQLSVSASWFVDMVKVFVTHSEMRNAMIDLVNILFDIFNHNFGHDEKFASIRDAGQSLQNTVSNGEDARSTAHSIVDIVSDTAEAVVPDHHRKRAGDRFRERNVPSAEETRQVATDVQHSAREKIKNLDIPEEYRESAIKRVKSALKTVQSRTEYQDAVKGFFTEFDNLIALGKERAKTLQSKGKESIVNSGADEEFRQAMYHSRLLLENFANHKSLDPIINSTRQVSTDIQNDQRLADIYNEWKDFIVHSISDPDFIDDRSYINHLKDISYRTKEIVSGDYQQHFNHIFQSVQDFVTGIREDPMNKAIADDIRMLIKDMFCDESGNFTIKPELAKDFATIIPIVADKIGQLPIPRIDYEDEKYSFSADDIVVLCSGLLPKFVDFNTGAVLDMDSHLVRGHLTMTISKVQVAMQNVHFTYKKKTGFFRLQDEGLIDAAVTRNGLTVHIKVIPWFENGQKGFKVDQVKATIDKLSIRIHDTKHHRLLYKLIGSPARKFAKQQMCKAIEDYLRKLIEGRRD